MSTRKVTTIPGRRVRPISRQATFNPSGGLNNNGSPNFISDKEWSDMLNMQSDEGGVVRKRMGYKTYDTALTNARGLGSLITDSINHICTIDDTTFKYNNGGGWTSVGTISYTANKIVSFTQARSKLYVWNTTNGGSSWDGTTLARPGTMPSAGFSVFYNSYHVAGGTTTQPTRLYFSTLENSSVFTDTGTGWDATQVPGATVFNSSTAQYIDINPGDGDPITGLGIFSDTLIVFKLNSIYQITLEDTGSGTVPLVLPITKAAGCVAHRSIVNVENDLYFLARDGVRFLGNEANYFNSLRTSILTRNIEPIINSMKADSFGKASATYYDNEYIISIPDITGAMSVTLCYHREFKSWFNWSNIDAESFIKYTDSNNDVLLLFLKETGTQVYEFTPNVYSDDGVPINAFILSKVFDFKNPDITKYFVDLGLMFRTISGQVNLEIYTEGNILFGGTVGIAGNPVSDGMGITMLGEVMLGLGGGQANPDVEAFADTVRRVVIQTKSTTLRFKISNNRNNENFVLLGYIHAFYPFTHFLFDSSKKIYI